MTRLHASLKVGRNRAAVRAQIRAYIKQWQPTVATFTEANQFRGCFKADGYTTIQPEGYGELAAMVREDVTWEILPLSTKGIPRRGMQTPYALVIHGDGETTIVVHLPSGVEGLLGLRKGAQADVWRDCIETLAEYVTKVRGPVRIVGDFNVPARRRWVKKYLRKHFPAFRIVHTAKGTHTGGRAIDFQLTRGIPAESAHVLANPVSDHKAVLFRPKEAPVKDQTYPKADTTTQWFQSRYSGSRMDANCGVLHTTESTDWPGYNGGATAPNLTAKPNIPAKRLLWRQHFDMDRSSRALQNDAGGVETNTLNVAQVELVGTCDPAHRTNWGKLRAGVDYIYWPDAPDWVLAELADFLVWADAEHGIPLDGAKTWLPYPASYGQSNPNRFSFAQWRALKGWCGHQHVPENDHGDPGDLNFARVLELAKGVKPTPPKPDPKPPVKKSRVQQARDLITEAGALLMAAAKSSRPGRAHALKTEVAKIRAARNRLPKK